MKLLIDSANLNEIKYLYKYYPIDGVTTNPSILLKENRNPYEILKEIQKYIENYGVYDLHVQVISSSAKDIIEEANRIVDKLGDKIFVKIPTIEEGLCAIDVLSAQGFKITATAIYTPQQAYLAAKAGALYVAPYYNRIENLYQNGFSSIVKIFNILKNNNFKTNILAASFKNSKQVIDIAEIGIDAVTVPVSVIREFLNNQDVLDAVKKFNEDFYTLCGKNATM